MNDLRALQELLNKAALAIPKQTLKIIGAEGNKAINKSFRDEAFNDGNAWQSRKDGDTSRALLVGHATGGDKLINSFKRKISMSALSVTFYTYKNYAKIHNEGGNIKGNFRVRSHVRRSRSGRIHNVSSFNRNVNFNMPKRQFFGPSNYLNNQIKNKVTRTLDELMR